MDNPSRYEIEQSMATRRAEMEAIGEIISQYERKIRHMQRRREELKALNFLDAILLKELNDNTEDNGSNKK